MTSIGILGSGRVATALAVKLANEGHNVTIGTRDVAALSARWSGPPTAFADHAQTARIADVVINALPGQVSLEQLSTVAEALNGKILVDVSNATERGPNGMPGGLSYPNSSLAEHLQKALPGTRVVKTLNTMLYTVMVAPRSLKTPPTAFLSGDDTDAKAVVAGLLSDLGWPEDWIEDLGGIVTARGTEAFMLMVPDIMRSRGFAAFALTVAR